MNAVYFALANVVAYLVFTFVHWNVGWMLDLGGLSSSDRVRTLFVWVWLVAFVFTILKFVGEIR